MQWQWQPANMELMVTIPNIEFVKGIPSDLEHDTFFDITKRNLMVIDDQMEDGRCRRRRKNRQPVY